VACKLDACSLPKYIHELNNVDKESLKAYMTTQGWSKKCLNNAFGYPN